MAYPSLGELQTTVQNPNIAFSDPDLRRAVVETTQRGLPLPRSGGFAVTFRFSSGPRSWAVRCFHREVADLEQRYANISSFLKSSPIPGLVNFEYQPDGILVQGSRYPIVKMDWVEGQTLGSYVNAHVHDRARIARLAKHFEMTVSQLESRASAHGDLQHGNVLVHQDMIVLIDYDGMFVPGMKAVASNELGHVNYQSPLRTEKDFSGHIDRFSSIVISTALEALVERPDLWKTYSTGENLLFQRRDFVNPIESPLLKDLREIPKLAASMSQFEALCRTPLSHLPRLSDFASGTAILQLPSAGVPSQRPRVRLRQFDVIHADDRRELLARRGQRVEVVGQVAGIATGRTRYDQPYAFINLGDWTAGAFTLVVWSGGLAQFEQLGIPLSRYDGKWISIVGLLDSYNGKPQITVEDPNELRLLNNKQEAEGILAEGAEGHLVTLPTAGTAPRNADVRQTLTRVTSADGPVRTPASRPIGSAASKPSTPQGSATSTSQRNQDVRRNLFSAGTAVAPSDRAPVPSPPPGANAKPAWIPQPGASKSIAPKAVPTNHQGSSPSRGTWIFIAGAVLAVLWIVIRSI